MEIRLAKISDLDKILEIYDHARKFMIEMGNKDQWIDGYPNFDIIKKDINERCCYVCEDYNEIVAVFSFIEQLEPNYKIIKDGDWKNELPYAVIHRMAVNQKGKGIGKFCLDWCFEKNNNLRIDTHKQNLPMQKLIIKCGFEYCGVIYVENGSERLAYQKTKK